MPRVKKQSPTVRRSVALPPDLVEEARRAAPYELKDNFNLLVREALKEYVARRRREDFAAEMARMATDPQIQKASQGLMEDFESTLADGLT